MRKVRNVTRFTSSLTPKDKVEKKPQRQIELIFIYSKFKFLHFLGINDMEYVKKIRIQ